MLASKLEIAGNEKIITDSSWFGLTNSLGIKVVRVRILCFPKFVQAIYLLVHFGPTTPWSVTREFKGSATIYVQCRISWI